VKHLQSSSLTGPFSKSLSNQISFMERRRKTCCIALEKRKLASEAAKGQTWPVCRTLRVRARVTGPTLIGLNIKTCGPNSASLFFEWSPRVQLLSGTTKG
jgi:hypothetical protein